MSEPASGAWEILAVPEKMPPNEQQLLHLSGCVYYDQTFNLHPAIRENKLN